MDGTSVLHITLEKNLNLLMKIEINPKHYYIKNYKNIF